MDSHIEEYTVKQNQFEKQIEELLAEKKMLQNRISVLNECLSYKQIKQKIFELETKQSILKSLEDIVNQMKTEIKPLDYLKQLLQKKLIVSSLSTSNNDLNIEKQKCLVNSELKTNIECAVKTLDSLSDDGSEDGIIVLSENDIISDDEVPENIEKTITNKVLYDEVLQISSNMLSLLVESSTSNIKPTKPSPNVTKQKDDITCCLQSDSKYFVASIDTSIKIKQLDDDGVKKNKEINCTAQMKLRNDEGKIGSVIHKIRVLSFSDETLGDVGMKLSDNNKYNNMPKSHNESWLKIEKDNLLDDSLKSEQHYDIVQITKLQKDNTISNANYLQTQMQTDELCLHQLCSKGNSEITNLENIICNDVHNNLKNEVNNLVSLTNSPRGEGVISTSLINMKCFGEPKVNTSVKSHEDNDIFCGHSTGLKENSEVKHFQNVINYKNEIHRPVYLDKVEKDSALLNIKHNEPKVNSEVKYHVLNNIDLNEFNEICELKNLKTAISNNKDLKNEVYNPVCLANNVKNENAIKSSLLKTKCPGLFRECNEPKVNIKVEINDMTNNLLSNNQLKSEKTLTQLCCINEFNSLDLNFQLLNGIHLLGFQRLMILQQQCITHCINGRDIVLLAYPCTGKSTMCIISVLQRINTSINECQAIILVPSLQLALFTQKIVKSLGKFMNVSTYIGGTNAPHKVSSVPHVVISTPQDLCDIINCNWLSKDFIKMLVIDGADDMIQSIGFFKKIKHILLFLKHDRQLIILATSLLEEILDLFSNTMQNPEYIILPDVKPSLDDLLQYYVDVPEDCKFEVLYKLYITLNLRRTIVYCNTWNKSLALAENLRLKSCTASTVSSEMDTSQKHLMLHQFRTGIHRMLVTTGLLKGEDFPEVVYIINYDLPKCPKNYVRRIVGCLSHQVKVINFITPNDKTFKENIETTFNVQMSCLLQDLYCV